MHGISIFIVAKVKYLIRVTFRSANNSYLVFFVFLLRIYQYENVKLTSEWKQKTFHRSFFFALLVFNMFWSFFDYSILLRCFGIEAWVLMIFICLFNISKMQKRFNKNIRIAKLKSKTNSWPWIHSELTRLAIDDWRLESTFNSTWPNNNRKIYCMFVWHTKI